MAIEIEEIRAPASILRIHARCPFCHQGKMIRDVTTPHDEIEGYYHICDKCGQGAWLARTYPYLYTWDVYS